jgi:hypothetical protein
MLSARGLKGGGWNELEMSGSSSKELCSAVRTRMRLEGGGEGVRSEHENRQKLTGPTMSLLNEKKKRLSPPPTSALIARAC